MELPSELLKRARPLVAHVKSCLFSKGTYQLEVIDRGKSFWAFLHIEAPAEVKEAFCSCEKESCVHVGAAYLSLMGKENVPLHLRFQKSLWKALFHLFAETLGFDFSPERQGSEWQFALGQRRLNIQERTEEGKQLLYRLFIDREKATEETSLIFSNLPQEELIRWREGRPSAEFLYELSYWSDFAKLCMWLGEKETVEVTFKIVPEVPHVLHMLKMQISFADFSLDVILENSDWPILIPALAELKTSHAVHPHALMQLNAIYYEPEMQELILESDELPTDHAGEILLGSYVFHPTYGFYPQKVASLLQKKKVGREHIAKFFERYESLLLRCLKHTAIDPQPHPLHYTPFFDAENVFHIHAFLFEPGDLHKPHSAHYGGWVYLEGKGFYRIETPLFENLSVTVSPSGIGDFINKYRVWLNQFEGFQIHLLGIDSQLQYTVKGDYLVFESTLELSDEMRPFGEWVYIQGKGFYPRRGAKTSEWLRPGLKVPLDQLEAFIHSAKEDLETVHGFFAKKSPLTGASLEVTVEKQGKIHVKPLYISARPTRIFKRWTYVDGEGFCPIPGEYCLPEPFTAPVDIDKKEENAFLTLTLPELLPFVSKIDPQLRPPEHLHLRLEKIDGEGALLTYTSELGQCSMHELWNALARRKNHLLTPAGMLTLTHPRFHWLKALSAGHFTSEGHLSLTTLEWIRLCAVETITAADDGKVKAFLEHLTELKPKTPPLLAGLRSALRPYQKIGVDWLWFLYTHKLSGLLCDEMGLGKTHQAMALVTAVKNAAIDKRQGFLIVCPKSVLFHWEELLKRFMPEMRFRLFYGLARTLKGFPKGHEILLTSYGTLRSEKQALQDYQFEVIIFDEVQVAKNIISQTHRVLKGFQARMKLGLTGTPIENRLIELKALFDIILPGYFPSDALYKQLFVTPIEKKADAEKGKLLKGLIRPFILRRKKDEVLSDLPEKTEEISYTTLTPLQQKLYKETFEKERKKLYATIQDSSTPVPYVPIFALFNKLKQICDHPALLHRGEFHYNKYASGKWDLLTELLFEAEESARKVVIFTQYLGMLDLFKQYFHDKQIHYAEIRGSTRDRREEVVRFNTDPTCRVFIGTLQAAGVGIDLIAGSIVIHYDRWWNPAKENQATDRVHRIGQSRGVQVFKMVTKHTIEEHIHAMIERKLSLLHDIIGYDDEQQCKQFSREELIELFKHLEADVRIPNF